MSSGGWEWRRRRVLLGNDFLSKRCGAKMRLHKFVSQKREEKGETPR